MELQTTKFIKGGIEALRDEISVQSTKHFQPITALADNGEFLVVFHKVNVKFNLTTRKFITVHASFHGLDDKLRELYSTDWLTTMLTTDKQTVLISIAKICLLNPTVSLEQSIKNSMLNYGND